MLKRLLAALAATLLTLCVAPPTLAQGYGDAVNVWGINTATNLPCLIGITPYVGTCSLPAAASSAPTYYATFAPDSSPITVTSTATAIVSTVASRGAASIENEGAVDMRCGPAVTVTFAGGGSTTGGVLVKASGGSWTWLNYVGPIWCITSSTSGTASVSETK